MTKFKNYFNAISGDGKIFSREDIANMTNTEYKNDEKAINYQLTNIGIPTNKELMNSDNVLYVKSYTKDDGTHVKAHYRSKPDKLLTNNLNYKADDNNKQNVSAFKEELLSINAGKNRTRPDAKELMDIFILGIENAPKNDKYTVIPKSKTKSINNALRINNSMSLKIENDWGGVRFAEDSRLSKNLSNSKQLQQQVKDYCQKHKNIDNETRIGIELTEDKNLHYSIGHGTILNPSIDKNGNFSGLLFDKYDFESQYLKYKEKYSKVAFYNEFAYAYQQYNKINNYNKNYYLLIPIKFKL